MAVGTTALAVIAGVGSAIAAGGKVIGAMQQAANLKFNAAQSRAAARQRMDVARVRARERRKEGKRLVGSARARLSASGVNPDTGSGLGIQSQTSRQAEVNALREIVSGLVDSDFLNTSASLSESRVGPTKLLGLVNAGATALTGAARIGSFGSGGGGVANKTAAGIETSARNMPFMPFGG